MTKPPQRARLRSHRDRDEKCCAGTSVTLTSEDKGVDCHQSSSSTVGMPASRTRSRLPSGTRERGVPFFASLFQRGVIQMIVVIVGNQHGINGRQVFETDTRLAVSLGACPGYGTATFRPDGVGQNIEPVHLNQEGGMADSGNPQGPFRHAGRGGGPGGSVYEFPAIPANRCRPATARSSPKHPVWAPHPLWKANPG